MSIQLGGRGGRKRSYADYRSTRRGSGPGNNPLRIILYLVLIGLGVLIYMNADLVRGIVTAQMQQANVGMPPSMGGATAGPTPTPVDYVKAAQDAYDSGMLTEAIDAYHQAGAAEPNVVDYPYQEARLLIYRSSLEYGDQRVETLESALDAASRAILADPNSPLGYAILGKVRDWQGKYDVALNNVQRALEFNPDLGISHSYLAEVLMDINNWEDAQASIDKAMQLDPNSVDVRRDYGYVLESLAYYTDAQVQYEAALQMQPRLPNLMFDVARMYRINGNYDLALERYADIEALLPRNALVPLEIGRTYETYIGDRPMAIEAYERAVEIDPEFASPWVRLGALYYVDGNYPQAIRAFEEAISLDQDENVDVLYQLGLAYAISGDCARAIPVLQKARSLAEDDERIIDLVNSGFETCSEPTPTAAPRPTATP